MKKKIIIITSIIFLVGIVSSYKIHSFSAIKNYFSWETKEKIIKYLLPYKFINILENEITKKNEIIKNKNKIISSLINQEIFIFKNQKYLNDKRLKVKYFKNENFMNYGPRAYFAKDNRNLYLVSGTTQTYFTKIVDLDNEKSNERKIEFKKIPNNLTLLLGKDFIEENQTITKGVEIINENIFISLVKKDDNDCHTNSIFKAKLNSENLNFDLFFDTKMCLPYFDNSSGGNVSIYKSKNILMTIGDWVWADEDIFPTESGYSPQNKNDFLGKILSINLNNPDDINMMALGTRNSQGLFYDQINDLIFFSDHGPQGGDEINVIKPEYSLPNYGWPIASYGEHYGYPENKNTKKYLRAPLNKPHKKYNFVEPIKYFPNESPAVSQIIKSNKFGNHDDDIIVIYLATLGDTNYGSKSIFKYELNKDFSIKNEEIYSIGERIRDMIYLSEINKIILYLETSGSIAILENS